MPAGQLASIENSKALMPEPDRGGLAIHAGPGGTGYLASIDQIPGGSILRFYRRAGAPGAPHVHDEVASVRISADGTAGLDVVSAALPGFPGGLVVAMNSGPRNFLFFSWDGLLAAGGVTGTLQ